MIQSAKTKAAIAHQQAEAAFFVFSFFVAEAAFFLFSAFHAR